LPGQSENGELVVRPVRRKQYELSELLAGVDSRNLHEEVETGAPLGLEARRACTVPDEVLEETIAKMLALVDPGAAR
jgi:hypothetical protein